MDEQQFRVLTPDPETYLIHSFYKGDHQVAFDEDTMSDPIILSDGGFVQAQSGGNPVQKKLLSVVLSNHQSNLSREREAEAILTLADSQLDLFSFDPLTIHVELPGRNGCIAQNGAIVTSQKDW